MAHSASAKKRNRTSERDRLRNVAVKSRLKTYVKHAEAAIEAKDPERMKRDVTQAITEIDKAASKGVVHPSAAGRKKSTLQRRASAATR